MTCKILIIATIASFFISLDAHAQVGPGFDLTWSTIDCGGETSTGGSFILSGTIGQPDATPPMINASFSMSGGFWPAKFPGCCLGDANLDKETNFTDITEVLANWGFSGPICTPGDANRDGIVNFADVTAVLANIGLPCF